MKNSRQVQHSEMFNSPLDRVPSPDKFQLHLFQCFSRWLHYYRKYLEHQIRVHHHLDRTLWVYKLECLCWTKNRFKLNIFIWKFREISSSPTGVSGPSFNLNTISECWSSMRNRGGRLFLVSTQLTLLITIEQKITSIDTICCLSEHFRRTFLLL